MPELPEVETVRRGLERQIVGRVFAGVSFLEWPRTIDQPDPETLSRRLAGRRVRGVRRRAKFLIVDLDDAAGGGAHLIIHLRMTGQVRVLPHDAPRDRFERVAFRFTDGDELRFSDIRRFGRIALLDRDELAERFRALGPEPLGDEWRPEAFVAQLAARRTRLKPLLLDQSFLAGLGNIYVDEALFRARLHPLMAAADVPRDRAEALYAAIREVLTDAIASGGTTFSNYRDAFGQEGDYYERRRVYGRTGDPCPTCGAPIARIVVGGRGTHFCPACQPAPAEGGGRRAEGGGAEVILLPARRRQPLRRVAETRAEYDRSEEE